MVAKFGYSRKMLTLKANKNNGDVIRISGALIKLVSLSLAIAATYFLTIQSLKIELADKAERVTVRTIDKKLTNLELILREGVVSKEEFFKHSKDIELRLSRIEYYLIDKSGEKIGKN